MQRVVLCFVMMVFMTPMIYGENVFRMGVDFSGSHKTSIAGSTGTQDVKTGINLIGESYYALNETFDLGLGSMWQIARELKNGGGFSFLPIYAALRVKTPETRGASFYGLGQLGYNFFFGDTAYRGTANLSGGMYYGLGAGVKVAPLDFLILYSVNNGSASDSGLLFYNGAWYYYKYNADISYSKILISVGYGF